MQDMYMDTMQDGILIKKEGGYVQSIKFGEKFNYT